jgi:hypothetical protein
LRFLGTSFGHELSHGLFFVCTGGTNLTRKSRTKGNNTCCKNGWRLKEEHFD